MKDRIGYRLPYRDLWDLIPILSYEAIDRGKMDPDEWDPSKELSPYALIRDGYHRCIEQAAERISVSKPSLNRYLRSLRDRRLIKKRGNRKSYTWTITK